MQNTHFSAFRSLLPIITMGLALASFSLRALAAPAPTPVLSISVPSEINLGDSALIIVNAKYTGVNIVGLPITQVRLDFPDDPITGDPLSPSVQLLDVLNLGNPLTDANGNVSVPFDPLALGIPANLGYTIRAQSGTVAQTYQTTHTVSLEFCIKDVSCGAPFSLALTDVTGPGELLPSTKTTKYSGDWWLTYTVKACTDIVAGTKVQGGVVGWAIYKGSVVTAGTFSVSAKNKNSVITWILPEMAAGEQHTITVHISGNSSSALGTQFLSGAWSAVYQTQAEANNVDSISGLPAPIAPHKSEYTPRASFEVVAELTP